MRTTSLLSYSQVPDLSNMQERVFDALDEINRGGLRKHPNVHYPTDREIADHLDIQDPNVVRPRRNELMEANIIVEVGKRKCTCSGRLALTWKVGNPNIHVACDKTGQVGQP